MYVASVIGSAIYYQRTLNENTLPVRNFITRACDVLVKLISVLTL